MVNCQLMYIIVYCLAYLLTTCSAIDNVITMVPLTDLLGIAIRLDHLRTLECLPLLRL